LQIGRFKEILRVHGRAARALANQSVPYSVCTILKDEDIYNPIEESSDEKGKDIRSRFNGRMFLSWLQDVDDKWEKIKVRKIVFLAEVQGCQIFLGTMYPNRVGGRIVSNDHKIIIMAINCTLIFHSNAQ
jgi:hypothetical protein